MRTNDKPSTPIMQCRKFQDALNINTAIQCDKMLIFTPKDTITMRRC